MDILIRDFVETARRIWTNVHSLAVQQDAIPKSGLASPFKSTTEACAHREAGNELYKKRKLGEALSSYTISIAYAFADSEELYKAYGNRSAVLFELDEYVPCLLDVNRALNSHCPSLLRQKLQDRKERCLTRMKSSTIGGGVSDEIDADATNPIAEQETEWRADVLSKFGNPLLPNASPKIKLNYNEKWGRHFVATEDIQPGESLISEDYFVIVFSDDNRFKYCDLCLKPCSTLIPCPSCTRTMYCSDYCRTRAYDTYHRMECKLSSLIPCDDGRKATVMRMFLIGTEQGAALENLMDTLTIPDIFVENFDFTDKPTASDYITALRLARSALDPPNEVALDVFIALQRSAFFESIPVDRLKDAEIFTMALLLNNFSVRYVNELSLNSASRGSSGYEDNDSQCNGIILLQYLFNHSCDPNVGAHQRGRKQIMFAIQPIKKDEQLFYSYHDVCIDFPKAVRMKSLDFICECEACSHSWPSFEESNFDRMTPLQLLRQMIDDCISNYEYVRHYVLHEICLERCLRVFFCHLLKCSQLFRSQNSHLFLDMLNVTVSVLDDTTLINLRMDEIIQVVVRLICLLRKVMSPWSYPLKMLPHTLRCLMKLYYNEREFDPSLNKSLNFPNVSPESGELMTMFEREMQEGEIFLAVPITNLFFLIARLNTYIIQDKFTEKRKEMLG